MPCLMRHGSDRHARCGVRARWNLDLYWLMYPRYVLPRDALEGKGPQRRPQKRLDRRLEEVAEAVGGGYCRLQMPLRLALAVRGT